MNAKETERMMALMDSIVRRMEVVANRLVAIDDGLARMQTLWAARQDEVDARWASMDRQRQEALDREMEQIRQANEGDFIWLDSASTIAKNMAVEGTLSEEEVEEALAKAFNESPGGTA